MGKAGLTTNVTADNEPLICEKCGHINLISRTPFSRREKKVRTAKFDDIVWTEFRRFKAGFPDSNAALSYLMHKVRNVEEASELEFADPDRFKDIIVKEVNE